MSEFKELVKSFPKTREYIRDFFVYGFKTREEFKIKSPRTYDNERRRLECWLKTYVRKDHRSGGSNISLAIDSNLLDTNPLFQVWKTKSFTDNDIVLHFLILDLLQDGSARTAEEITDGLLAEYEVLFDIQIVRRKCNAYAKEGLFDKKKEKKTVRFSLDLTLVTWIKSNESALDALTFYQMACGFGIIGNGITEQMDFYNQTFRVKHSFFVHTLEDEILLALLEAMDRNVSVRLELKSSRNQVVSTAHCLPLQIFISTRSGRRFLCGYIKKSRRFSCFRLDAVKRVIPMETEEEYAQLLEQLERNRPQLWGVSFQGPQRRYQDTLTMTLQVMEPDENYIVERLKREGRGGTVIRIGENIWQYETSVFDCNEMLPWIRTFTGRILSLNCTAKSVERRFYQDLERMYGMYGIERDDRQPDESVGGGAHGTIFRNQ